MNENSFPINIWENSKAMRYWEIYQTDYREKIDKRNEENRESNIVDKLIELVFSSAVDPNEYPLHAWELAILTRRQRATWLATKISDAIERIQQGNEKRFFSFFNQITQCWILFYFKYGGTKEELVAELNELAKLKVIFEKMNNGFTYSIFGYGFRKSMLKTEVLFDDINLTIEDAKNYSAPTEKEIRKSQELFGHTTQMQIREFPK